MKQLRRWTTILGLALLAFTAFAVTAEAQARTTRPRGDRYERPDYDRNDRGYERNRGDSRAYSLARELEWASRLFVLDMMAADEEGIGTTLQIEHLAPAFAGETLVLAATFEALDGANLRCAVEAWVGPRLVATGHTGHLPP